jgi:hypothetical protein
MQYPSHIIVNGVIEDTSSIMSAIRKAGVNDAYIYPLIHIPT